MLIPSNILIDNSLKVGVIYKFYAPELINTEVWHYFVIVGIEEDETFLLVCTTKLENRVSYCQRNGIDLGTIAYIRPNKTNGLTKDSYIDCNRYFTSTKQALITKHQAGKLQIAGEINREEYQLILDATELSETFALPKSILKFT